MYSFTLSTVSAVFDTVNHQIILITGHHRDSTSLILILSQWQVFQGGLGRRDIQRTSTGHWGSSGISSWTPPLLHIHYITWSRHTSTWFLIPVLCRWHTVLALISTRYSNGSCTDLRLPVGHLGVDERTSPTAQPGKDWASCLPWQFSSDTWKLISCIITWLNLKKKKQKTFS